MGSIEQDFFIMNFIKQPLNFVSHADLKSRLSKCQYDYIAGSWAEIIQFFIAYPHQLPYHFYILFKHQAAFFVTATFTAGYLVYKRFF